MRDIAITLFYRVFGTNLPLSQDQTLQLSQRFESYKQANRRVEEKYKIKAKGNRITSEISQTLILIQEITFVRLADLTHFQPMFHLRINQVVGFY